MNLEQLGLFGVFLFGAIPWFEAIAVVPGAILLGSPPVLTVVFAVAGNTTTIFLFAYAASQIRAWLIKRRALQGKTGESERLKKAQRSFDKWGIYGLAAIGPLVIGTQFAALAAVAAGVKPLKTSIVISVATLFWATLLAIVFVVAGLDGVPGFDSEG
ncbi:small multi-drug export protein [Aquiluna sp.]|nr:small multi-drug export protein [Aquiluna sp.]MDA8927217.1 small multi-drug export protein [Aquiluna sp.]